MTIRTFEFTDAKIKGLPLPPEGQQMDYYDTKVTGLMVRVSYGGTRAFRVQYGKSRKVKGIGKFGKLEDGKISLAEARKRAKIILAAVSQGADPADEAKAQRQAADNEIIFRDWLAVREKSPKRKSVPQQRKRLEKHVFPAIGSWRGSETTSDDIEVLLDAITERGAPIMANRIHEILKTGYGWALKKKNYHLAYNPALSWERNPENKRDRFLSLEEIKAYWNALDEESEAAADCLRLCLLLAQRHDNIRGMQRDQLFLDDKIWRVPASATKTSTMNKVPLSKAALDIINRRLEATDDPWLFPKRGGGGYVSDAFIGIPHRSACKRAKIENFTIHDMRHCFATHCDVMGIPRLVWDGILGHSAASMAELYSGFDFADQRLDCMEKWADRIAAAVGENVVDLPTHTGRPS